MDVQGLGVVLASLESCRVGLSIFGSRYSRLSPSGPAQFSPTFQTPLILTHASSALQGSHTQLLNCRGEDWGVVFGWIVLFTQIPERMYLEIVPICPLTKSADEKIGD
jgi:hypothetical protein